jgi:hypothetical protein
MTDDLIVSPLYWTVFVLAMVAFLTLNYRPLDFKFFIVLPVAQRIAHLSMLPSSYLSSFAFALAAGALLIVGYVIVDRYLPLQAVPRSRHEFLRTAPDALEMRCYIVLASVALAGYFIAKLLLYPQFFSALDYGERLQAQQDHRFLFFMNLATPPALTALVFRWVRNNRLNRWDKFLALMIFVGYMASGSKGAIAPVLMIYFGIATYLNKEGTFRRAFWVIFAMIGVGAVTLIVLFPAMSASEIASMIAYRVVANSEELEYLYVLHLQPDQYPFAGIGALFAPIAKVMGENIEYTPGVWLYGERYGNFTGYGPNAGFIIEMFGNLGYSGLVIPLAVGGLIAYCGKKLTLYRVVLLSILPLLFQESLMFFIALTSHLLLITGAKVANFMVSRRPLPAESPAAVNARSGIY